MAQRGQLAEYIRKNSDISNGTDGSPGTATLEEEKTAGDPSKESTPIGRLRLRGPPGTAGETDGDGLALSDAVLRSPRRGRAAPGLAGAASSGADRPGAVLGVVRGEGGQGCRPAAGRQIAASWTEEEKGKKIQVTETPAAVTCLSFQGRQIAASWTEEEKSEEFQVPDELGTASREAVVRGKVTMLQVAPALEVNGLQEQLAPDELCKKLQRAVADGDVKAFQDAHCALESNGLQDLLRALVQSKNESGGSILSDAVRSGSIDIFTEVLKCASGTLGHHELRALVQSKNESGGSILSDAVRSSSIDIFTEVLKCTSGTLGHHELRALVQSKNESGGSILSDAVRSSSIDIFTEVLKCTSGTLGHHEFREILESEDGLLSDDFGRALLRWSIEYGDLLLFEAAVGCVLSSESGGRVELAASPGGNGKPKGGEDAGVATQKGRRPNSNPLKGGLSDTAIKDKKPEVFAEYERGRQQGSAEKIEDLLEDFIKEEAKWPLLGTALLTNDLWLLREVSRCADSGHKVAEKRSSTMDAIFSKCVDLVAEKRSSPFEENDLRTLSSIIASSARPTTSALTKLARTLEDSFKTTCLRAVTVADNPFVSGNILATTVSVAANMSPEGEKRKLYDVRIAVDALLLEVFERLPQTVRGFGGGSACCEVLEPRIKGEETAESEKLIGYSIGNKRPLTLMFEKGETRDTYSSVPLIIDFMSYRFTQGLPDLSDTYGVVKDRKEHGADANKAKVLSPIDWFIKKGFRKMLRGDDAEVPSLTMFPGAQYVVAGLVGRPNDFYEVPAMRLALDFVVYVAMVAALSFLVLFQRREGATSWEEVSFGTVFILAGVWREIREMWRGLSVYFNDRWNVFDVLGLICLSIGLGWRGLDGAGAGGAAFYALSAPMLVVRVLFFAQILHFQGPMIEVVFAMTKTLLKFGFVMAIVMLGFAMSFHIIFQDSSTFRGTFLDLFKAMLGEVGYFDTFTDDRHALVATALLVMYLVIVTILLLNLLVAILSTSHAQVQDRLEQEFNESKGRMIGHYLSVVAEDRLPAPFNLVQLVLMPFFRLGAAEVDCSTKKDKEFSPPDGWHFCTHRVHRTQARPLGRVVFWLMLGPVAVAGGALLWIGSAWHALYVCHEHNKLLEGYENYLDTKGGESTTNKKNRWIVLEYVLVFLWCTAGAPAHLFLAWLTAPIKVLFPEDLSTVQENGSNEGGMSARAVKGKTVESMLWSAPGKLGIEDLSRYLQNPMLDNEVRQDETSRTTTVEHVKLLRDRLVATTKDELKDLREELKTSNNRLGNLEILLQAVLDVVKAAQTDKGDDKSTSGKSSNATAVPPTSAPVLECQHPVHAVKCVEGTSCIDK